MNSASLQHIVEQYIGAGKPWPATVHSMAAWAISEGLWRPKESDLIGQCADQLSRAMRDEYITDPQGRSIRAKHVARISKNGKQLALWEDIRTADSQHMGIAFQQRREQIVGDCTQLRKDVDSYNENWNRSSMPINLVLDFTQDVAERQTIDEMKQTDDRRDAA
jgi:hypothetical protein